MGKHSWHKLEAVGFALEHGKHVAGRNFDVDKCVDDSAMKRTD